MKTTCKLLIGALLFTACTSKKPQGDGIINLISWKFNQGDNLEWANPGFDDSKWTPIDPERYWESQGFENYDGYGWYRTRVVIPSKLKENAYFKDSVYFTIGKVDDTEQTFLNGQLIGQNGNVVPLRDADKPAPFEGDKEAYNYTRSYALSVDDPRIKWDEENVIAVRVNDHMGNGGLYSVGLQSISMKDVKNLVTIDNISNGYGIATNGKMSKKVVLTNSSATETFTGTFEINVNDFETGANLYQEAKKLALAPGSSIDHTFEFNSPSDKICNTTYAFYPTKRGNAIFTSDAAPYFLTPKSDSKPRINGAKIYGVRPGTEFIYAIAASGDRPMKFEAANLPAGLSLNDATGVISGISPARGEYLVDVKVSNAKGEFARTLKLVSGDKLALTPPMGWNSWNCWGLSVSDEKVRQSADFMVSSGLQNYGWSYINIDDGWEATERNDKGELLGNEKFPDFKALADYIHSKGLKIGIYSSPGPLTCGKYLGSYNHEEIDAATWAAWGFDYLKYDWCSYTEVAGDMSKLDVQQLPYIKMRKALDKQKRDIVYSLCQYGMADVWKWGAEIGGNLWRTTGDIVDTWQSVEDIGFSQYRLTQFAQPGHWNDPDMLVVGWVGWGPSLHPSRLTAAEQYTHITLWSMLAAPLLLGNDLSRLDEFTLNLLTNAEVIDINQDALGKQAARVKETNDVEIFIKDLDDGTKAVAVFNMADTPAKITINLTEAGISEAESVRDIWRQKNLDTRISRDTTLLAHGSVMFKVKSK